MLPMIALLHLALQIPSLSGHRLRQASGRRRNGLSPRAWAGGVARVAGALSIGCVLAWGQGPAPTPITGKGGQGTPEGELEGSSWFTQVSEEIRAGEYHYSKEACADCRLVNEKVLLCALHAEEERVAFNSSRK